MTPTSKEVFAKRREGALDEAYQMALQLVQAPHVGEWDFKALAWCLIDLIKREVNAGNQQDLPDYCHQLEAIKIEPSDDVLQKSTRMALSLCHPQGQQINLAKALSREEKHAEAIDLYLKVLAKGYADREIQTNLGWEFYKHAKQLMAKEPVSLGVVRRHLNDYLGLQTEKPSLLHSCMLQLASKLAGQENLNMLAFSRLWNLDYLRPEDFERYRGDDGKEHPSLAEKVIQQASKEAVSTGDPQKLNSILPYVDTAIERLPDNIWLRLNKAKILRNLGRNDDALAFGLEVTKSKVNEYWAWELLGDICDGTDPSATLGCYCKALLCTAEDKYTGKVRLKLAQLLIKRGDFANAKYEVERVVAFREKEEQKIPQVAMEIAALSWFAGTQAANSNFALYTSNAPVAETLLFRSLPWINANVGIKFTAPGKEGKPRRKIFVKTANDPMEVSIPESTFKYKDMSSGDGLLVKGELDANNRFQIYLIERRHSINPWDIFPERIGVIDHINKEKGVAHFVINKNTEGILPFTEFEGALREGDAIAVKLATYTSNKGRGFHVLKATATEQTASSLIKKRFREEVRVSNGMGFTDSDIFIPPPLVKEFHIENGHEVSGTAVLSYNKKRASWGWKAVSIENDSGDN